jgi:hypothetical protein
LVNQFDWESPLKLRQPPVLIFKRRGHGQQRDVSLRVLELLVNRLLLSHAERAG